MRRLLAVAILAVAASTAAPASAEPICTGGNPEVCVTVLDCVSVCRLEIVVDGNCTQGHPATLHCATIDRIHLDWRELIPTT